MSLQNRFPRKWIRNNGNLKQMTRAKSDAITSKLAPQPPETSTIFTCDGLKFTEIFCCKRAAIEGAEFNDIFLLIKFLNIIQRRRMHEISYPTTYSRTLPNRYIPPAVSIFTPTLIEWLIRENFGMIEDDLYRSGQPNELNFPFLERLGLRTIVFLAPEDPNQKLYIFPLFVRLIIVWDSLNFIDDQEIQLQHLGLDSTNVNAWDPISEEVVLEALEIILNPRNYPLMVMCNLGRHRTGTFAI